MPGSNDPSRPPLFSIPTFNIEVRWSTLLLALAIVVLYMMVWRPGRGYIAQELVRPPVASFVLDNQQEYQMRPGDKSVLVEVYHYEEIDSAEAQQTPPGMLVEAEPQGDGASAGTSTRYFRTTEYIFGTPWGFYLVFPLLALLFIRGSGTLIRWLLILHLLTGLLCIGAYISGFYLHIVFMHLYKALTYYGMPGLSFLLVFIGIFQHKFTLKQDSIPQK